MPKGYLTSIDFVSKYYFVLIHYLTLTYANCEYFYYCACGLFESVFLFDLCAMAHKCAGQKCAMAQMITNPDWQKPKIKPYHHQISLDCIDKLVERMEITYIEDIDCDTSASSG